MMTEMRWVLVIVSLLIPAVALGMMSKKANDIPKPEQNFRVIVTDRQDFQIEAFQVSIDSNLYLSCKKGSGTLYIDFGDISEVEFGAIEKDSVRASLKLHNGDVIECSLNKNIECTGYTDYGPYRIRLNGLKAIRFLGLDQSSETEQEFLAPPSSDS